MNEGVGLDISIRGNLLELKGWSGSAGDAQQERSHLSPGDALQERVRMAQPCDESFQALALEESLRNRESVKNLMSQAAKAVVERTDLAIRPRVTSVVSMIAGREWFRQTLRRWHKAWTNAVAGSFSWCPCTIARTTLLSHQRVSLALFSFSPQHSPSSHPDRPRRSLHLLKDLLDERVSRLQLERRDRRSRMPQQPRNRFEELQADLLLYLWHEDRLRRRAHPLERSIGKHARRYARGRFVPIRRCGAGPAVADGAGGLCGRRRVDRGGRK